MTDKDLRNFINNALKEDVGKGDHTSLSTIALNSKNKAHLLIKDNGIIAGIELAKKIFNEVDPSISISKAIKDGDIVQNGDIAFQVEGNSISILSAERLVLNCMQRMSGIATKTNYLNSLLTNKKIKLLDTRKTTPLNRIIEKWAVRIGGGKNHRFGLDDMILIKDNHIDFSQSITDAIQKSKTYIKEKKIKLDIIVEARNINEVKEILNEGGIRRILLDNFNIKQTKEAINIINKTCEIESSGNINENNIIEYGKCEIDFISIGALTHSVPSFDLSLKAIE